MNWACWSWRMTVPERFEAEFGTEARIKWFGTDGPIRPPYRWWA